MADYAIAPGRTIIAGGVAHTEGAHCAFLCPADVALFLADGIIVATGQICPPILDDEPAPVYEIPSKFPASKYLPGYLDGYSDPAHVRALWRADGRSSADRHYRKRLKALE